MKIKHKPSLFTTTTIQKIISVKDIDIRVVVINSQVKLQFTYQNQKLNFQHYHCHFLRTSQDYQQLYSLAQKCNSKWFVNSKCKIYAQLHQLANSLPLSITMEGNQYDK